jgi:methylphosphotriester-DNA--protein-cysteine methyltransferase
MGWSKKYKRSIDCNNPKGFSQKAHCAGRKKRNEETKMNIKELVKTAVREVVAEDKLNMFLEKNVPTDKSKWSYYKSQAKKKFDVYPSAYANAWAAKQYKAAGGGWRKTKG